MSFSRSCSKKNRVSAAPSRGGDSVFHPEKRSGRAPAPRGGDSVFRSEKRSGRAPAPRAESGSAWPSAHRAKNGLALAPVSRAENKLAGAASAFKYDFRGKTVLDIGSSTGGFTEYALARGAQKVVAIEKGTNQMKIPLRFDPRIDLREKTDIFDVDSKTSEPLRIDTILADVSFISLTKVLSHAKAHLAARDTDFLVMLKPQFEARPDQLFKGVVKNEKMRREIIKRFETWLSANGFILKAKRDNSLAGRNGNVERFYWLKLAR